MKAISSIRTHFFTSVGALLFLAVPVFAQGNAPVSTTASTGDLTMRQVGEHEFTLGGNGASSRSFDDSLGGVNFSYGWYTTPTQLLTLRQSINYSNPSTSGQSWSGSTRLAFDQHLTARGPLRPFVGVIVGGVYGEGVRDTFTAGLEAGAKYYVQPRTFIYAMVEYGWFFRHARNLDDRFDDGQFTWGVGVGFNF